MKKLYLIHKNGQYVEISSEEWTEILQRNRFLPTEQKRYFISSIIFEDNEHKRVFYEVSLEKHRNWNKKHMNAKRDKDKESKLKTVSLEEAIEKDSEITLCPALNYEDMIISDARIEELKVALKSWEPWAMDIFDIFSSGDAKNCSSIISRKYAVSAQTARSYIRKFKKFIKEFLL